MDSDCLFLRWLAYVKSGESQDQTKSETAIREALNLHICIINRVRKKQLTDFGHKDALN